MPREEIARGWRELGGRGMCEIRDRAVKADDRGSIVSEEKAGEGS